MPLRVPLYPPAWWFDNPQLSEPTAITIDDSGRVRGHAFLWGTTHAGVPGQSPPRENSHELFMSGVVKTKTGEMVPTGRLSLGGGHADLNGPISAAVEHYDEVASAVADISVGNDRFGLFMAGCLRPDVTEKDVRVLRASSVSGDWRHVDGRLRLIAICAVSVPGFAVPRAKYALAAAGKTQTTAIVMPGQRVKPATTKPVAPAARPTTPRPAAKPAAKRPAPARPLWESGRTPDEMARLRYLEQRVSGLAKNGAQARAAYAEALLAAAGMGSPDPEAERRSQRAERLLREAGL